MADEYPSTVCPYEKEVIIVLAFSSQYESLTYLSQGL